MNHHHKGLKGRSFHSILNALVNGQVSRYNAEKELRAREEEEKKERGKHHKKDKKKK